MGLRTTHNFNIGINPCVASLKIAANTWIWTGDISHNTRAVLEKVYSLGFDGVEIPTLSGKLQTQEIKEVLGTFSKSSGFPVIIIGGGVSNTDILSEIQTVSTNGEQYIKDCIDRCYELDGSLVCGPLYTAVGKLLYLNEQERAFEIQKAAIILKKIAKYASDRSVKMALEPLCRYDTYLINTVDQGIKLMNQIDEDNVGLLLDSFHMNIEERSLTRAIRSAGNKLFHFHACENDRGPPGFGQIKWNEISEALNHVGYSAWMSIESFTPFDREFSSAMRVWRKYSESQDELAASGLRFLRSLKS